MPWIEISLSLGREEVDEAEQLLERLGALAVTLEDDEDHPILEPAAGSSPLWPHVRLRGLFEQETDRGMVMGGSPAGKGWSGDASCAAAKLPIHSSMIETSSFFIVNLRPSQSVRG